MTTSRETTDSTTFSSRLRARARRMQVAESAVPAACSPSSSPTNSSPATPPLAAGATKHAPARRRLLKRRKDTVARHEEEEEEQEDSDLDQHLESEKEAKSPPGLPVSRKRRKLRSHHTFVPATMRQSTTEDLDLLHANPALDSVQKQTSSSVVVLTYAAASPPPSPQKLPFSARRPHDAKHTSSASPSTSPIPDRRKELLVRIGNKHIDNDTLDLSQHLFVPDTMNTPLMTATNSKLAIDALNDDEDDMAYEYDFSSLTDVDAVTKQNDSMLTTQATKAGWFSWLGSFFFKKD
ncbi:hypothetical protein BC940DRAFT_298531 [Gongronella butleri]|nr:hypothetical protein BC940DRAFT_298531 [Gongronella butleri]